MNKKSKLPIVLCIAIALIGLGLVFYKPIMTKFIIPKMHDHISKVAKDTSASTYSKNQKDLNQLLKSGLKSSNIEYDPNNFSQNMDDFNNSVANGLSNNNVTEGNGNSKNTPNVSFDYSKIKPASETDLNTINPNYDKRLLIGHVALPSLGIDLPIIEGVADSNLYVGACTLKPFQQMGKGNYALASHHMPDEYSNFSRIGQLQKGSMILLGNGRTVYEYRTSRVEVMPINSGQLIDDVKGDKLVTLVTCTDTKGTARIVVQGKFVKTHKMSSKYGQYFHN